MQEETKSAQKWLDCLKTVENDSAESSWVRRSKRIVKRYRDERESAFEGARFNILWSNTETISPAIYSRPPKAEVSRRNKDKNPISRTAASILERSLQYEIEHYPDFDEGMKAAVQDRLLCGRGVVWIRYERYDVDRPEEPNEGVEIQPTNDVLERACVDYVYWEDFRTGHAKKWADVPWVARREYMTKKAGIKRFGEKFKEVPLHNEPIGIDDTMREAGSLDDLKKAAVWEIWDKEEKQVYWVAEGYPDVLDDKPDPYGLDGFFPCPKPLYATQTNDRLTPVPDFSLYQDQADEIDILTSRIKGLSDALKLNGAYDGANSELSRILSAAPNTLIPVENWAGLSEKGGLAGVMQWVPLKDVVAALQAAYLAREEAKQVVYEITGISDIIRGATQASETATAQNIKRQFGSLRLTNRQRDVAMFATEILRMKAQLMMDIYRPQTLIAMSGINETQDAQYVDQALMMMQDEPLRSYQIEIAADSLVAMDEEQEKTQRMEFLTAIGGYIREAVQATQTVPELAPLAMELMMFAVRAFPAAKPVEGAFEQFQESIQNRPPVDPNQGQQAETAKIQANIQIEEMKLQFQAQAKQAELQAEAQANQIRAQADIQVQQSKMQMQAQLEQQRSAMQAEIDRYRAEVDAQSKAQIATMNQDFQRWKTEIQEATKIQIANITSKAKVDNEATSAATSEIAREIKQ
ncbi:MAG: hypothetical protein CL536_07920 [Alcaligenaceae bacterium]|nr:hypothetical protein [Alcaligenaceae bacterium]